MPKLQPWQLTNLNPELEQQRGETYPGMAHWAGSGPQGYCCKDCSQFMNDRCMVYTRLIGKPGPKISGYARSCKYFEEKNAKT